MRLFVAIELERELKNALKASQKALRRFDELVRWTREDQMHLTLKFLGEVLDDRVPEVCEAVERAASASSAFDLTIQEAGCFPPDGRVRVVWVGVSDGGAALATCQQFVADSLGRIGFAAERRPFRPHLTLGRVKDDRSEGKLHKATAELDLGAVVQRVESIGLVRSELSPNGARYTVIGTWALGGG